MSVSDFHSFVSTCNKNIIDEIEICDIVFEKWVLVALSTASTANTCSVEEKTEDFQELFSSKLDYKILSQFHQSSYKFCNVDIACYKSEDIEQWIVENNSAEESVVKSAAASHSDLLPAVYEGGLTVWECGCDLAEFISGEGIDFRGKSVIELGCGAGLPGICAMKCGAEQVYFQDYNSEVISYFTIPNVQLNETTCQCRFFSGDWGEFQKYARNQPDMRFDYILTAETIYSSENYPKLHSLLETLLKVDGQIVPAIVWLQFGVIPFYIANVNCTIMYTLQKSSFV
uniref:protein-histidine N-methyltransferase n=1 Tax=Magallana gigas TaxID=29159 RepID=K1R994_MAGGI